MPKRAECVSNHREQWYARIRSAEPQRSAPDGVRGARDISWQRFRETCCKRQAAAHWARTYQAKRPHHRAGKVSAPSSRDLSFVYRRFLAELVYPQCVQLHCDVSTSARLLFQVGAANGLRQPNDAASLLAVVVQRWMRARERCCSETLRGRVWGGACVSRIYGRLHADATAGHISAQQSIAAAFIRQKMAIHGTEREEEDAVYGIESDCCGCLLYGYGYHFPFAYISIEHGNRPQYGDK
eukprot:1182209-Pleurochrysis_carterae.AAC.3